MLWFEKEKCGHSVNEEEEEKKKKKKEEEEEETQSHGIEPTTSSLDWLC